MPVTDTYSFADAEPLEDVLLAWDRGEKGLTAGPRSAPEERVAGLVAALERSVSEAKAARREAPDRFERAIPAPMETR